MTEQWCIYDIGDDVVIVTGTRDEMIDLLDTMSGNLIATTLHGLPKEDFHAV